MAGNQQENDWLLKIYPIQTSTFLMLFIPAWS